MPTGKRASMREGPLADLFRKTAEDDERTQRRGAPRSRAGRRASRRRRARAGRRAAAPPEPAAPPSRRPSRAAARIRRSSRRRGAGAEEPEARSVPSPQERLRHAFSADIPENLHGAPRAGASPRRDVYARADATCDAFPAPAAVGQPVLRVVGVGGAGVNAVNRMVEAEIEGVEFLAINTDLQSLQLSAADETLHIGDASHPRAGLGLRPRPRPAGRARGVRPHQGDAARLRHGVHRRRRRRRHRHRRRAGRGPDRPRARRADGRHRHPAVPVRGLAPPRPGRGRDRGAAPKRSTR